MSELLAFILDHEEAFRSRGRLASLYSDFRLQLNTNPDGYNANVSAWKKALADATRAGVIPARGEENDLLSIRTGEELSRALASKEWGRPMALGAVIHDAVKKKEMVPLKDFLTSQTSIYSRSWTISPWQIISWGLRQLGVLDEPGSRDNLAVGNFVVMANVEAAASSVLQQMTSRKSNVDLIFSRNTFADEFRHTLNPTHALTETDLAILLTHLSRDMQAIVYDSKTIKFKSSNESLPSPITSQDATIANLRDLISSLNAQLSLLTAKITNLDSSVRAAVACKSMATAKTALRSKKLAEATMARRTATLTQLEEVFNKIEQAVGQVETVKVMEASASVLKSLHNEVGGAEGIEGVVDALREQMDQVDEVSGVLNEARQGGAVVDEMEVEEEFEALEKAQREKEEKEEAEKARVRLAEIDRFEKERREKRRQEEEQREQELEKQRTIKQSQPVEEQTIEHASQELRSMSLEDSPAVDSKEQQKPEGANKPLPAS
ncbi:hypothetical protein K432DRAFT_298294 [Lepidopterella palustris CBS 459.81]|uniref:Snf7-domain-containing protein n=1 Tax=Lepidopterella palustris CBS 459.81 TaxID=1314670 RepID=A0A8E2E9Z0_9PEZI|nr:hypothetical protein K432DRAFT_298294 [Lepidopterella palustris CBS 459.81]